MKIVFNRFVPFRGFLAINLFGVLFVRGPRRSVDVRLLNHEKIHTAQIKELCYIPFYLLYVLEWLVRLCGGSRNAYRAISFEREAYGHDADPTYLSRRRRFAMWRRRV